MRALLVLTALALLAGGGPARARSPGRHTHVRLHHPAAKATWRI